MKVSKTTVFKGVFWNFIEKFAAQVVSLIVSIVLARLLDADEYGTVSLVMVFITIANVFVTSGFGISLIQKKEADNIDFSTVFYFSLFFSAILYTLFFILAGPIANFYNRPILKPVIRVLMLCIPVMGINSVQQAYVSRNMLFKKMFCSTLIGTIISAFVGIILAYLGFGVWALVAQTLSNTVIGTIILQFVIEWRPIRTFSFKRLGSLFNYGSKLLLQSIIVQIYSSLRSLIIGKLYTPSDLAFYTKGNHFPELICNSIDTAINSAIFPAMSKEQELIERVKVMARRTVQVSSYVMNPILIGFIVIAEPFISVILTDKWLPAVPYLRICCVILLFRPVQTAILQAVKAIGRSDMVMRIDIPIRIFALCILFISIRFGVIYIALSEILVTIFGTILYAAVAKKHIGYRYNEMCKDLLNNTIIAVIMGVIVWIVGDYLIINKILVLLIQVISGVIIYLLLSTLTKNESYKYILNILCEVVKKKG